MDTLLMIGAFGALMYFMMVRPAQKKLREQQDLQSSLAEGDRVLLASGIYGTLKAVGDKQAVIEVSDGVDLTITRAAIVRVVSVDEDEFEYADEGEPDLSPMVPAAGEQAFDGTAPGIVWANPSPFTAPGATIVEPAVEQPAQPREES